MAKYTELITKVIDDFDSVLYAILNKRETGETSELVWGPERKPLKANGAEVPTEYYGELINQLVKIDGIDNSDKSENKLHRINAYTKGEVGLTLGTVTKGSDKKYKITANVGSYNGYYTKDSTLSLTVPVTDVTLTKTNVTLVEDEAGSFYTYESANGLIGVVKVAKGSVTGGIQLNDFAIKADLGETTVNENKSTAIAELVPETDSGNEKYYVTIDTSVEREAVTITADSTAAVAKDGYITSAELDIKDAEKTIAASSTAKTIKLAIKKGSVSAKVAEGAKAEVSLTAGSEIWADSGIAVTSTVGNIALETEIVEGYIKSGDTTGGTVKGATATKYIKRTSAYDVDLTPTITAGSDTIGLIDNDGASTYTIKIDSKASSEESFGTGYLTDGDFEVNSNGSKTVHLNAGAVSASSKITSYGVVSDIATTTKTANNDYVITVTPTIDVSTKSVDAIGVITAATQITNTNATIEANASKEVYVKRGSVVVNTPVFDISYKEDSTDGAGVVTGELFKTSVPTSGDYFQIDVNAGYTITDGYVTEDDGSYLANKQTATRYMPKAVLSWKKAKDSDEEVLTVDTAGYLPSGIISEFAPEGTLTNNAVVDLALTLGADDTGLVFQGEAADGVDVYTFTINKGSVDAGYISSNAGSLAENNFYITKAKFNPTVSVELTDSTGFTYNEQAKTYKKTVTASATGNANINTAGFVKLNENISVTDEKAATLDIEIAQADITLKHSASLNLEASSKIETVASSPFSVSAAITSCKSKIETTTAGYIDSKFNKEVDLSKNCVHTGNNLIYIKAGQGINTKGYTNDSVTVNAQTQNITENAAGNFEVTATVNATAYGEILSGYYDETIPEGDPINDIAINVSKANLKVATIERGKGSVSLANTSANVITSDAGIVLHDSNTDTSKQYIAIKADATVNANSTLNKAGYINANTDIDVAGINGQVITAATKYIEAFKGLNNVVVGPNTAAEAFTVGASESVTIATGGKYVSSDVTVTIGAHAMGSAVENELLKLEQRLNGILA